MDGIEELSADQAERIAHGRWAEQGQDYIDAVADAPFAQRLAEVLVGRRQFPFLLCGVREAEDADRGVECEAVQLCAGGFAFSLEEATDVTGEVKDTFIDGSPVELRIDGATVDCKRLYARIGNQQVIFIVKLDKPGRHEIKIGSQSTSVLAED